MATLKREVKKLPSESNLRLLSSLIVSLANKQSSLEDKCIAPWKADETYQKDISYVSHNGYIYICSVTNQDSVFTESHWTKLADEFTELDVDTIKSYLNLTQEQITNLQTLIDDTTITTTKTNSSSKIYMDIQAAIAECKDDTLKQIAKKVSGSYKIATSTAEVTSADYIYLINNGANYDLYVLVDSTPTKVGDTSVDLSDYAKLTDLADYLKKTDAASTYATITTVDGKVDKTDITTTIDSSSTNDTITGTKAIYDYILANTDKFARNYSGDLNDVPFVKANCTNCYTVYSVNCTNLPSTNNGTLYCTYYGDTSWGTQLFVEMATGDVYSRCVNNGTWTNWIKVIRNNDITQTINSSSTDTQVPSAKAVETRVNKVNKCTVHSNEDLNLITEPGLYACVGGDTYGAAHNFPVPDNGYLQHIAYPADGYCMQTFVPNGVWGGELNMYVRRLRSGVWSSWQRLCGTTVADVEKLTNSFIDTNVSGSVTYVVKNGICTVKFWPIRRTTAGMGKKLLDNIPIPKGGDIGTSLNEANGDGSVTAFSYVDSSGNLFAHFYKDDSEVFGSFSYPVKES